jgi:hypothetical protein
MTLESDRTRRRRTVIPSSNPVVATSTHATFSASASPGSSGDSFATMASLDGQFVALRTSIPCPHKSIATIIENEDNITLM